MRRTLYLLPLAALLLSALAFQQDEAPPITAHEVSGPVHYLEGRGGNIGVSIGDDGTLIIDDQFDFMVPGIEEALETLGGGSLKFVLNTHWHGDHTGGNAHFGKIATIVAHESVRDMLSTPQTLFGRETPAAPEEALPVITYGESMSVHFNGEELKLAHLPGHTNGDTVIYFTNSKVVHMGDLFFSGRFPFVDVDHGGGVVQLAKSVGHVIDSIDETWKIIPGHGPLSTLEDLKAYQAMLIDCTFKVEEALKAGKDAPQMLEEGLLNDYATWGEGFISTEQFLALIIQSIDQ